MKYEKERQRYGRNINTKVNSSYIESGGYRNKFDKISSSKKLNRLLYMLAKKMLKHRSGTLYEDMYWIDADAGEIIFEETNSKEEEKIIYNQAIINAIKNYDNIITIHNHPNSFPPSISDLNSNWLNGYTLGIVICHNGDIYLYSSNEEIGEVYYKLSVAEYEGQGYNDYEAQFFTLKDLERRFDISFKEVK